MIIRSPSSPAFSKFYVLGNPVPSPDFHCMLFISTSKCAPETAGLITGQALKCHYNKVKYALEGIHIFICLHFPSAFPLSAPPVLHKPQNSQTPKRASRSIGMASSSPSSMQTCEISKPQTPIRYAAVRVQSQVPHLRGRPRDLNINIAEKNMIVTYTALGTRG